MIKAASAICEVAGWRQQPVAPRGSRGKLPGKEQIMTNHTAGTSVNAGDSAAQSLPTSRPKRRNLAGQAGLSVLTTKVALLLPSEMLYPEWERTGQQLVGVLSSSAWWLGDWLIYGREQYSDRYEKAVRAAGLQYQTLRNYAWVAGKYPVDRRRVTLSFQHHAELAGASVEEQERWLQRAQEHGWSLRQLRSAYQDARGGEAAPSSRPGHALRLVVSDDRHHRWTNAATLVGIDLEQWMTVMLDRAAEQVLTG